MRTIIKTPNSVTGITPYIRYIIRLCNLSMQGVHIDIKDLTMEDAYYMEYFSMKRRNAEELTRFKTLFGNLTKLFQALAKSMRGRI